ncbi:MAG: hypothetical protein RMY29_011060 [Nostoc sp. CreGUA01]
MGIGHWAEEAQEQRSEHRGRTEKLISPAPSSPSSPRSSVRPWRWRSHRQKPALRLLSSSPSSPHAPCPIPHLNC